MGIYLLVLGTICLLGAAIEYGKSRGLTSVWLIGKKEQVFYKLDVLWLVILLILILFGGLRYKVGRDYDSYCTIFVNLYEDWNDILYGGTERGYVWLNRIVTLYTNDPQWIIFITNAVVSCLGVHCLRKYCKFAPFGLYLFFTTLYYYSFNLIRQGMAAAFILLAFCYARDRKWIHSMVVCLIASLFHQTALMMIPVLLLMQFRYQPAWYFVFFAVAALCTLLREQITYFLIATFYPNNLNYAQAYAYDFSPVQVALCAIYMILCLLYYRVMLRREKGNMLYINFSILIFGIYSFFFWIPMWSRLNLYFIGLYALIVPEAVSCENEKKTRALYYAVMLGILLFFYIMPSFVGTDAYSYSSVFSRPADYLTQLYTPQ
ncbi:MAG: EpsG family protein [Lachnospiraceae bacterium]|nr:EpsG family protein [Lachnospiraceae bacterium]